MNETAIMNLAYTAMDIMAKSLMILLLSFTVVQMLRKSSAAARCLTWQAGLAALLILPILSILIPPIPFLTITALRNTKPVILTGSDSQSVSHAKATVSWSTTTHEFTANSQPSKEADSKIRTSQMPPAAAASIPTVVRHQAGIKWQIVSLLSLFSIWGIGTVTIIARMLFSLAYLARSRKKARIVLGTVQELASSLYELKKMNRTVSILCGGEEMSTLSPMTWGLLHPVILLPVEAESWTKERLKAVLLHELAHIARHDWTAQIIARLVCAIYWFNPLVWLAAKAMRAESEVACDDMVLSAGINPSDYAAQLLAIVRMMKNRSTRSTMSMSIAMAKTTRVESRTRAILDAGRSRIPLRPLFAFLTMCAAGLFLLPLAAIRVKAASQDNKTVIPQNTVFFSDVQQKTLPSHLALSSPLTKLIHPEDPVTVLQNNLISPTQEVSQINMNDTWKSIKAEQVSWGRAVNGLKAGISIHEPQTPIKQGQSVTFHLWLKNIGKTRRTIKWSGSGWTSVTDDKKRISITRSLSGSANEPISETITLLPGVSTFAIGTNATFKVVPKLGSDLTKGAVLIADTGNYTVSAVPFLPKFGSQHKWLIELVTGPLSIQVVEAIQQKIQGLQSPDIEIPQFQGVSWGPINDGLQAGLKIAVKGDHFHQGQTIPLACYIRNTTNKPIALSWTQSIYMDDLPMIHDAKDIPGDYEPIKLQQHVGKHVTGVRFTGMEPEFNLVLPAGETVILYPYGLTMGKVEGDLLKVNPYLDDPKKGTYFLLQPLRYELTTIERAEHLYNASHKPGAIIVPGKIKIISAAGKEHDGKATTIPAGRDMKSLTTGLIQFHIGADTSILPRGPYRTDNSDAESVPKKGQKIIWGKIQGGLQGGICFTEDRSRYKIGEQVRLNLYWRNVTQDPITISYVTFPGSSFPPDVEIRSGKRIPMEAEVVLGLAERTTIPPGKTLFISHPVMVIAEVGKEKAIDLFPRYYLTPGRYRVYITGNERDTLVPESGRLDFEVTK